MVELMRPAAPTSFDIAIWFLDRARAEDTYVQPRMLQCLLFLAQAHYAAAHEGRPLMPAFFVVDDSGPLDPNVHKTLLNIIEIRKPVVFVYEKIIIYGFEI